MLRRASLALFTLALGFAIACGRQVTPSPTSNNNLAGTIQILFQVAGPLDFTNFNYWIVFNTSGQGGVPYAPSIPQGNYKNFSYAFLIGASSNATGTLLPILLQFYSIPGVTGIRTQQFNVNPSLTSLNPNFDGAGTQFQLVFTRSQLALPPPTSPTNTPVKPSSSPTPSPTPTGSAPPSSPPSPVSSATVPAQSTWFCNLFVTDANNHVLDALGLGPTDQSFTACTVNVNSSAQIVYNQPPEQSRPPNPSSQLAQLQIINTP
jgi:hypothetical protein